MVREGQVHEARTVYAMVTRIGDAGHYRGPCSWGHLVVADYGRAGGGGRRASYCGHGRATYKGAAQPEYLVRLSWLAALAIGAHTPIGAASAPATPWVAISGRVI